MTSVKTSLLDLYGREAAAYVQSLGLKAVAAELHRLLNSRSPERTSLVTFYLGDREMFTPWTRWTDRGALLNIQSPGVYAIAISPVDLKEQAFNWQQEISYIGHSDRLIKRLTDFDAVLCMKRDNHSGAKKMRQKYSDYDVLREKLYVSVYAIGQGKVSKTAACWRRIGEARKVECDSFAIFKEKYERMPEFNH